MFNVGLDFSCVIYDRGVSRYTYNLAENLIGLQNNNFKMHLFASSYRQKEKIFTKIKQLELQNKKAFDYKVQNNSFSMLKLKWNFLQQNKIKSIWPNLNLYHTWDYLQPPDKNLCFVSTVHDLALFKNQNIAHKNVKNAHLKSINYLKKRNAHFIAVSLATKKDMINIFQIPPFKIDVVYEALPNEIKYVSQAIDKDLYLKIKEKFSLDRPFIFFVGTREPRKNLKKAILAWSKFSKYVDFIIAGESGWDETENLEKKYENLKFLGKVSDQELAVLYNEAELFLYPSLDEGFGLPILESFYFGTPVVTSDILALKEVAGNAACFVNPQEVESIEKGIKTILNENSKEKKLRFQKMVIRNQRFSWKKTAKDTLLVYQKAYHNYNA